MKYIRFLLTLLVSINTFSYSCECPAETWLEKALENFIETEYSFLIAEKKSISDVSTDSIAITYDEKKTKEDGLVLCCTILLRNPGWFTRNPKDPPQRHKTYVPDEKAFGGCLAPYGKVHFCIFMLDEIHAKPAPTAPSHVVAPTPHGTPLYHPPSGSPGSLAPHHSVPYWQWILVPGVGWYLAPGFHADPGAS